MSCSPDISFEHFDPQFELGQLDANGKPIRPRKKPGRKPNPPSPAQRKAQNRAAQRAFRERKRREMREAESTVKQCLYLRDQALAEARRLKTKVDELRYENNYLKGQFLTLKMACIANRVDVPKLWDLGDKACDSIALSRTKDIPQALEIFLDKQRNIINLAQRHRMPTGTLSPAHTPESFVCSPPSSMVDLHQHETDSLFSSSPSSSLSGTDSLIDTNPLQLDPSSSPTTAVANLGNEPGIMDLSQHLSLIAPQLASHLDSPFFQQLLNTDLISGLTNSPSPSSSETTTTTANDKASSTMEQLDMNHWLQQQNLHPKHLASVVQAISRNSNTDNDIAMQDISSSYIKQEDSTTAGSLDDRNTLQAMMADNDMIQMNLDALINVTTPELDAKTGVERQKTKVIDDEQDQCATGSMSLSASKLKSAPPMNPVEALQYIRTVKNLDNEAQALFQPTELQRTIHHDPRIDHIPGPMMRDLMILFQDFYNANELFDLLVESATFLGGDISNPDCWIVPPCFIHKFWFLCPNHRPDRVDNLVEIVVGLGQEMLQMMMERKAMYLERDRFADYFPSDDPSPPQDNRMSFDAFVGNDFSLDDMMTLVNNDDLLATL
ncbi:hypothetical protein BC941DRAFT_515553 [Chlamydoabsidia padenii]|nr:hypothetical protein BC941DRAFT_515553 [Chlamydoabsidia padenii]